jgi:hypothetical protein
MVVPMSLRWFRRPAPVIFACFALAVLLTSCASSGRAPANSAASIPRVIELEQEQSVSTFHFPRGLYSLQSEDDAGYYYRAPRRLIKHSFAGFAKYDGGLFVPKNDPNALRGYVVWAGGLTKIGNLGRAHYAFRG